MTRQDYRRALKGRPCYLGLDLSSTQDLTALVGVFPDDDGYDVLAQFYCPLDTLTERVKRDRVPYDQWRKTGDLTATSGNAVDYEAVRHGVKDWGAEFDVREIGFDPWNATDLMQRLELQDGFKCVPIRQGFTSLTAPTKALEIAILSRTLRHDGHPILRWCISNVSVETDPAGNRKVSKKTSTERIDGVAALVMAVARMDANAAVKPKRLQLFILGGPKV